MARSKESDGATSSSVEVRRNKSEGGERFYLRRAFGRHRDHWDFDRILAPCGSDGVRGGSSNELH